MAETKARKLSYERRAACILKKAMELQTLCDLKIGVVILSPDGKLESWPPQLNDVKALLHACKERGPRVKSDKRKEDCREILVSKLHLLNQREELFKGKEIATGGETLVRSKKTKDFGEQGCLEILNSKLQLLKKREMLFLNRSGKEIVSMEGIESQSLCDGVVLAFEACYPPQNSFTALGNGLPSTVTASEECGELQVRKKARLQYPTAALNNNLPQFTPEDYWEAMFTDVVNSTDDVMLSLLEDL
nr:agamous-like MADS-box protein AGL81 [Ipomoea batatas]